MTSSPDIHWSTTLLVAGVRQLIQTTSQLLATHFGPPAFDTSHLLVAGNDTANIGGLRWDAIHYVAIAKHGYTYEQQLAFMPLWPLIMRLFGEVLTLTRSVLSHVFSNSRQESEVSVSDLVLSGGLINVMLSAAAAASLYKLTRALTGSHRFARLSCLFYALPPHPAASTAPYTEPLFAFLTFTGFYFSVKQNHARAAVLLALATGVRATGIFNIAILGWHILFGHTLPSLRHMRPTRLVPRASLAVPLCLIVIGPFLAFQYYAYLTFCFSPSAVRPWCHAAVPVPYSFVQVEYWNNGLFNYWTLEQLPNFLLAAPVLLVSIIPSISFLRSLASAGSGSILPLTHHALLPFHLHHLLLTALLIFGSHTQIALRTAITDPVVWWNVAAIAFRWEPTPSASSSVVSALGDVKPTEKAKQGRELLGAGERLSTGGRIWVGWAVIWGAISLVLWSAHLPPA